MTVLVEYVEDEVDERCDAAAMRVLRRNLEEGD